MKPVQLKMARAAVGWGVRELAERAGVAANLVTRIENGADAQQATIDALQQALESAGVTFVAENRDGPGVRMRNAHVSLDQQIAAAKQVVATPRPQDRTPEAGMVKLRRGLAKNDLRTLTEEKRQRKPRKADRN